MLTYCPDKNTSTFSIELSIMEKVLGAITMMGKFWSLLIIKLCDN